MTGIAAYLEDEYTLRSGGADGADSAFELGITNGNKEIYLPWEGFNNNDSNLYGEIDKRAEALASKFHGGDWKSFKLPIRQLHARNVFQVLGQDLQTPSEFVLCYTSDFCESHTTRTIRTGGTGTAISIADHYGIPIINMSRDRWQEKLLKHLKWIY